MPQRAGTLARPSQSVRRSQDDPFVADGYQTLPGRSDSVNRLEDARRLTCPKIPVWRSENGAFTSHGNEPAVAKGDVGQSQIRSDVPF